MLTSGARVAFPYIKYYVMHHTKKT